MVKVYGSKDSFRTQKALVAAKLVGKDATFVAGNPPANKFPLHVLPALEDGNVALAGEDAIAVHLLGNDYTSQIQQWVSYGTSRLQPDVLAYVLPSVSAAKVDHHIVEAAKKELFAKLKQFDEIVKSHTYLVGERLSYADVSVALDLLPAFQHVLADHERKNYVNVTRWFQTIIHQAPVKAVLGEVTLAPHVAKFDEATYKKLSAAAAPKKEEKKSEKKEQPKKEEKPKKPAEEPEDDPAIAEPKFVDPLGALPAGSFVMDNWKRVYSNEDTVTKAIPYFWENFDSENYSIWYGEYKYPEDLTLTFMSCNLITGMFQRLDKMRKHAFGSVILFGGDHNSTISGVWIWRGQDLAFSLSPDWQVDYESYDWKKLDAKSEETKKIVNEYWAWEGDFVGKKFNQGKIFK